MPKKYFSDNKGEKFTIENNQIKFIYQHIDKLTSIIPDWVILLPSPVKNNCF